MHRQKFPVQPVANPAAVVGGKHRYRFTVLTDGLIRYEWAPDNQFEDRASVFAICRDLPVPDFRVKEKCDAVEIITARLHLTHDKKAFSPSGLSAVVKGAFGPHASVWRYGEASANLGGTARTLDEADGRIALGPGVISRGGFATLDDSDSMLFDGEGFVAGRRPGARVDGYLFAYGHDYRAAVHALYAVSGSQPILPRWALGNWWSRYHPYRAEEYLALMDRFRAEGIPLSVAVIDMDWHLYGEQCVLESGATGWTGYTWNRKLIPDPAAFITELHRRDLKTALNDHPAEGVYGYEDPYEDMAKALSHDTSTKDPIPFDITDQRFLNAFFDVLHRPFEDNEGIDFWWTDWQQGSHSRIQGLNPLWMLNHFTFLENSRRQRPLTFSRYAGPGSHRYPIGFSGDSVVSWASLDFQPEFTSTASNIGYGWWSHDIGGHLHGGRDDELETRWVQFGVFSPMLRLHSSNNWWNSKEPWKFRAEFQVVMTDFLRLRHRLLPYIYTMNVKSAQGLPLMLPMYWDFPRREEAYRARNQYCFGSELVVIPVTSPQHPKLRLAKVRGWLPPGRHVDIFSGAVYDGDRELWLSRPLSGYPVFAREGSIVPLDAAAEPSNGCGNPDGFEVLIAVGANGAFEVLEDDGSGKSVDGIKWTRTPIIYNQAQGRVQIGPAQEAAPKSESREWSLRFLAMTTPKILRVFVDGLERKARMEGMSNGLLVTVGAVPRDAMLVVELGTDPQLGINDPASLILPFLDDAQLSFGLKMELWKIVTAKVPKTVQVTQLHALEMDSDLLDALLECVLADCRVEA